MKNYKLTTMKKLCKFQSPTPMSHYNIFNMTKTCSREKRVISTITSPITRVVKCCNNILIEKPNKEKVNFKILKYPSHK